MLCALPTPSQGPGNVLATVTPDEFETQDLVAQTQAILASTYY